MEARKQSISDIDVLGEELFKEMDEYCRNAEHFQRETLEFILQHNAQVEYLQSHDLNGRTDPKSFKQCIPITNFSDYHHHIDRIADGEKAPILSADPLLCMFFSSGSSSLQPKLIPYFDSQHSRQASKFVRQIGAAIVRKLFPSRPINNKSLAFMYAGKVMETKGGIKAMAASAYAMRSTQNPQLLSVCISPREVLFGSEAQQQMYCHLLCGLRMANMIDSIRSSYAPGLLKPFRLLQSKWEQLCEDIHSGYVNQGITDTAMREAVEKFLEGPRPEIAETIRRECRRGEWGGIVGRLWPNVRYMSCVSTGSMEQYYAHLKYYAGDVPLLGGDLLASECSVGLNMDRTRPPQQTSYTIVPTAAYFEFLPVNEDGQPVLPAETVDMCHVQVGHMYEVVVTTFRGLYRYRLGDIVRITGFYKCTPRVEYVGRVCHANSIVNEKQLTTVMDRVGPTLREETEMEIAEFACFADILSCPKHIEVYWEVRNGPKSMEEDQVEHYEKLFRKYRLMLEDWLSNTCTRMDRSGNLGALELYIVKEGSFDGVMEVVLEKGAIASQYKSPKIIQNLQIVSIFRSSVLIKLCE